MKREKGTKMCYNLLSLSDKIWKLCLRVFSSVSTFFIGGVGGKYGLQSTELVLGGIWDNWVTV